MGLYHRIITEGGSEEFLPPESFTASAAEHLHSYTPPTPHDSPYDLLESGLDEKKNGSLTNF